MSTASTRPPGSPETSSRVPPARPAAANRPTTLASTRRNTRTAGCSPLVPVTLAPPPAADSSRASSHGAKLFLRATSAHRATKIRDALTSCHHWVMSTPRAAATASGRQVRYRRELDTIALRRNRMEKCDSIRQRTGRAAVL
jgi:hypothetical protein